MESAFLAVTVSFSIYAFRSKVLYLCGRWLATGPSESRVNYCPSSDYYYYFYTCAQHVNGSTQNSIKVNINMKS